MCQFSEILDKIREHLPDLMIKEDEPMKNHTSFRIGGPCRLMLQPQSAEELRKTILLLEQHSVTPILLGSGTNVLAPDEGIDGVVVVTRGLGAIRKIGETAVAACCGVQMARLATFAMELGLSGLEFAHGIPGTVGGGVFMNAGAYGGEIRQVAARTTFLRWDGSFQTYEGEAQGFRYRGSAFQAAGGVILETEFSLVPGDRKEIRAKMQELAERRRSKQPLELPSAGSTFKRPEGYFAGTLIEEAGLKGFRIGGAAVSEKHAGFLVNLGGATARDVRALIEEVQKRVYERTGVMLEPEVRIL